MASILANADEQSDEDSTMESHKTSTGEIIGRLEVPEDSSQVMKGGEAATGQLSLLQSLYSLYMLLSFHQLIS